MYRVVVNSRGKYGNVALGARYCLFKRSAADLVALFDSVQCDYRVEKFVHLSDGVFCWSEIEGRKIFHKKKEEG